MNHENAPVSALRNEQRESVIHHSPEDQSLSKSPQTDIFKAQIIAPTLDEISEEPVEWLWQNRIPLGSVTLLVAEPNAGKSYLTIGMAACLSRGDLLPGNGTAHAPMRTLLFEMEDTKGTVKERASLCKAVSDKVRVANSVERVPNAPTRFSLADIDLLQEHLAHDPETKLVVINPLAAIMDAGMNDYRELEVRQVISRLEDVARTYGVAIVAVRHFGKRGSDQTRRGLERVLGSIGMVAAARSVLGIDCDGDRRYLVSIKNNLGKPPAAVAFRITDAGLTFEGEDANYSSVDEAPNPESRLDRCIGWLANELRAEPIASTELESRATSVGHSKKTYQRAKGDSRFRSFQQKVNGNVVWFTELAATTADSSPDSVGEDEAA